MMRRIAPILLLCTTGCVELVAPPAEVPAAGITLELVDSTAFAVHVRGAFRTGFDADGSPHTIESPLLRIGGLTLAPTSTVATGVSFEHDIFGAEAAAIFDALLDGTPLEPPAVEGFDTPRLVIDLPRRTGAATATWQDDTLILNSGYEDAVEPDSDAQWLLSIRTTRITLVDIRRAGSLPTIVAVPAALLGPCTEPLHARLDTLRDRTRATGADGYTANALTIFSVHWAVLCP